MIVRELEMRLLLIEDDPMIGMAIEQALKDASYSVDWTQDGQMGLNAILTQEYGLLLLDLGLPNKDGLDILKSVRDARIAVPVIIITARDAVEDKVLGLDRGADDYLLKPFSIDELLARIRAVVRRNQGVSSSMLSNGDMVLDNTSGRLMRSDIEYQLSAREFTLMRIFMLSPGRVYSKSELENQIYGWNEEVASNALEVVIHGLRKKLGKEAIKNIRGLGWMVNR
jgi:two-component system OmpR family response regulator